MFEDYLHLWFHMHPRLVDALDELRHQGRTTPCHGEPELWHSSSRADRDEAAYACQNCLIRTACHDHAEAFNEREGVWAGIDRSRNPR